MSRFRSQIGSGFIIRKNAAPNHIFFLDIFDENLGLITATIRNSKQLTNRFQGKLELLTQADFELRTGSKNPNVTSINNVQNQHLDQLTPLKQKAIAAICQLCQRLIPSAEPNAQIYDLLSACQQQLTNNNTEQITIYFCSQLLNQLGILPNLKNCQTCDKELTETAYFQTEQPEPQCQQCLPSKINAIDINARKTIHYAKTLDLNKFLKIKLPPKITKNCTNWLRLLIANYIHKDPSQLLV